MTWTREKPTTAGWYWVRIARANDGGEIVRVIPGLGGRLLVRSTYSLHETLSTFDKRCEWCGPLEAPP